MKDTNLLVLVILFAITFGAYLFAYIFNFTNQQVKRQQPQIPPMSYPWPMPLRQEPQKGNMSVWPMAMFMFICAVLYLVYLYDGRAPDFKRVHANNNGADMIESPHIQLPDGYNTYETSEERAIQESVANISTLANKSAKLVGYIVSQQATEILSPLHYDKGWGIKLVTKESSLRWIDEFEAQLTPYLNNGRRKLLISSVITEDDVVLHRFYMGSFSTREHAQSILKYVKNIAPGASVVRLDQVDELRPFNATGA